MAANPNSDLSTTIITSSAADNLLPIVQVESVRNTTVKVTWGTLESQQQTTTASIDDSYTDTFHATDSTGVEPLVKTFGTLLGCHDGTLAIQATRYRIQVIIQKQANNEHQNLKTNILGNGVLEKLKLAVIYFVDINQNNKPIGTGFFVGPRVAISTAHTFFNNTKSIKVGTRQTGYHFGGKPHAAKTCKLVVDLIDWEYDFVIFAIEGEDAPTYLEPAPVSRNPGDECILVAYQLGMHNELKELGKEPSVGVFQGAIMKAHERHFVYIAPSFASDSGGAIILQGGQAVGMHIMTVNQARELQRLKSLDEDKATTTGDIVPHVNSVEESVASLIKSLSSGALALSVSSVMAAHQSNQELKRRAS